MSKKWIVYVIITSFIYTILVQLIFDITNALENMFALKTFIAMIITCTLQILTILIKYRIEDNRTK